MDRAGQQAGETGIGHRAGHHGVDRTNQSLLPDRPHSEPGNIVEVNARHPLPPGAKPPAEPGAEDGKKALHCAAPAAEDESDPQDDNAGVPHFHSFPLPGAADLGEEAAAGRGIFRHLAVARVAVVTDARTADEHPGRVGGAGETLGHRARAHHAAVHDTTALFGCPTTDHRLTGKVQDGIKSVDVGRFTRHEAAGARVARLAGERDHFPSPCRGQPGHLPADESRGTCDSEAHSQKVRRIQL